MSVPLDGRRHAEMDAPPVKAAPTPNAGVPEPGGESGLRRAAGLD